MTYQRASGPVKRLDTVRPRKVEEEVPGALYTEFRYRLPSQLALYIRQIRNSGSATIDKQCGYPRLAPNCVPPGWWLKSKLEETNSAFLSPWVTGTYERVVN